MLRGHQAPAHDFRDLALSDQTTGHRFPRARRSISDGKIEVFGSSDQTTGQQFPGALRVGGDRTESTETLRNGATSVQQDIGYPSANSRLRPFKTSLFRRTLLV